MSTIRPHDQPATEGAFPLVRKGYDRTAVDEYTRTTQAEIKELQRHDDALTTENQQLNDALSHAHHRAQQVDYSGLGGRAQEILRIAEEQARDVTERAAQEADQLLERRHEEVDRLRRNAATELGDIRALELGDLEALRRQGRQDAAEVVVRATVEADQLLASARLQADAVRTEATATATGVRQAAALEGQRLLATAQREAAAVDTEMNERREQVLTDLSRTQDETNEQNEAMLARATDLQRRSTDHLSAEAEEAALTRQEALAEAERVKVEAAAEADRILARAQQQAGTIDERARQEFAWRRRQMRHEQDLLSRRKQAMLSQLTSLSALAVETAESLPEVPELSLGDFDEDGSDDQTAVTPAVEDRPLAHAAKP